MKHFIILSIMCLCTAVAFGQDNSLYLQNAKEAFETGDYDKAIKQYKAYKTLGGTQNVDKRIADAENCKKNLFLADDFFNKKDYEKAAEQYFKLLSANPADRHAADRSSEIKKIAGVAYYADGHYVGEFDDEGKPHGHGVYYTKSEEIVCEWVHGKKEGNATIKYALGRNKKGTYINDIWIEKPKKARLGYVMPPLGGSLSNLQSDSWLFDEGKNPRLAFDCLGLFFEYKPVQWLSFQPELQLKFKGTRGYTHTSDRYYDTQTGDYIPDVLVEDTLNLTYVQLPLNLLFYIPVSDNASIFFGGGYYLAYGVYGKLHLTPSKDRYSFEKETQKVFSGTDKILNPFDQGINTMFGARFTYSNVEMFIRAGYEWSLDNMAANKGAGMATFKNNCFYLQMGGYF